MNNTLVPYEETKIGNDINDNDIQLLQNGAIIIRTKDTKINDINKNIKVMRDEIKKLKEERKKAEEALIPIMSKGEIECLNVSNGKIKYTEMVKKSSLNKKSLEKILISYFTDEENFDKLLNIESNNNIELAVKRTKHILDYIETKTQKKKIVTLTGIFN